jgi:arachidonate 15-lipoxygenase
MTAACTAIGDIAALVMDWAFVDPRLPGDERQGERRRRLLRAAQSCYRYLPRREALPSPCAPPWVTAVCDWIAPFMEPGLRAFLNVTPSDERNLLSIGLPLDFPLLLEIWRLDWFVGILPQVSRVFANLLPKNLWFGIRKALPGFDLLSAYRALFSPALGQPPPPHYAHYDRDAAFARERLDGPNPFAIERVQSIDALARRIKPADRPQLEAQFGGAAGMQRAIDSQSLFIADYRILADSVLPRARPWAVDNTGRDSEWSLHRDSRWRPKYLPAPVALFRIDPGKDPLCDLLPVAIWVDQRDANGDFNPLYLPGQPGWDLARLYVRVADANLHENASHNQRHHFVAGAFAAATRRQLAYAHPIHVLLEPHIAHTLMVNRIIYGTLRDAGSAVDEQFACDLEACREIMNQTHARLKWTDLALEADLARRGVRESPAEYPWRDDVRLWTAPIEAFVRDYLSIYYQDKDVSKDAELAAWFAELQSENGGHLDFTGVRLTSLDDLVGLLAQFLFLAGPSHASVHFPLSAYLSWAPAFPRSAYRPPPRPGEVDTAGPAAQRFIDTLPPIDRASLQFQIGKLADYRYGRFGAYESYRLGRVAAARPAISRLQIALDRIESEINTRNQRRPRSYAYLLPSRVPNSVNL